jgi:hypothetical protein
MAKIKILLNLSLLLILTAATLQAQDRYAVYFKHKPQETLSLSRPQEFLTAKALQRRLRENVSPDSLDLPVSDRYLQSVSEKSDYVLYTSKWMNAAILVTDETRKSEIESLPFVDRVELVAKGFLSRPDARIRYKVRASVTLETCKEPKLNTREVAVESNSYDFQNQLIGIDKMHEEGFTGKGVTVAVFDAGFPGVKNASTFAHLFANNQIIGQKDVVRPWNQEVFIDNQHGTNVFSLIAANEPEKLVSGAFESDFILVITEEVATEYRIEEFNWVRGAEYADSLGVDIINSSVGYWDFDEPSMNYTIADLDGKTTVITRGASIAAGKGILVVNSVGNYGGRGTSSLVAPADAEGILAIGSVTNTGEVSGFSSRGPTGDGRLKPDLVAFGQAPILVRSNGAVGAGQGTSFSAPQITALAAGLWQARPEWTKDQLILNLIRSATQSENPDNNLGYGVPNFMDAYYGEILSAPIEENPEFKVYPNPLSTDILTIRFGTGNQADFELVDLTGKSLINQKLERNSSKEVYQVDLQGIQPGLYVVRLVDGLLVRQVKLLKQ